MSSAAVSDGCIQHAAAHCCAVCRRSGATTSSEENDTIFHAGFSKNF